MATEDGLAKPPASPKAYISKSIRKACDFCHSRKKLCNGDGSSTCSLCIAKGEICVYSKRRPHKTKQRISRTGARKGANGSTSSTSARRRLDPTTTRQGCDRGVRNLGSLQRCRLSASPATGLVGMQENVYLSDYFGCLGFLPLMCQSTIREAMVKIFLASNAHTLRPESAPSSTGRTKYGQLYLHPEGEPKLKESASANSRASTCLLWCAVATGSLVKGAPVKNGRRYVQLAEQALESCSGARTVAVARAYAAMAFLYGLAGDMGAFDRYLPAAQLIIDGPSENGDLSEPVPYDFAELVRHADDAKIGYGHGTDLDSLETFLVRECPPLQMQNVASEGSVYRFMVRSTRRMAQAAFSDLFHSCNEECAKMHPSSDAMIEASEVDGERAHVDCTGSEGNGGCQTGEPKMDPSITPRQQRGAMARYMEEALPQCDRLQQAVDRPEIGMGIGGFMIHGALIGLKSAKGDICGSMKSLKSAIDILVRYPGLCRFTMGVHAVHCMTAVLAMAQYEEIYEKLRTAYNSVQSEGTPLLKPMAEREVPGFCDQVFCRSWQRVISSREISDDTEWPEHEGCQDPKGCRSSFGDTRNSVFYELDNDEAGMLRGNDVAEEGSAGRDTDDKRRAIEGNEVEEEAAGEMDTDDMPQAAAARDHVFPATSAGSGRVELDSNSWVAPVEGWAHPPKIEMPRKVADFLGDTACSDNCNATLDEGRNIGTFASEEAREAFALVNLTGVERGAAWLETESALDAEDWLGVVDALVQ